MQFDFKHGWREATETFFLRRIKKNIFTVILFVVVGSALGVWKQYKNGFSSALNVEEDQLTYAFFIAATLLLLIINTLKYYNVIRLNYKIHTEILRQSITTIDSVIGGMCAIIGYLIVNFFITLDFSHIIIAASSVIYVENFFKIKDQIYYQIVETEAIYFATHTNHADHAANKNNT